MLENAIAENTAAIKALTAVWQALVDQGAKAASAASAGDTTTAGGKVVKPGKAATSADTTPASTASSSKEKESPPALEYPTVQKAIVALAAKHGREAALATLKPFGVTSGKDLKAEQWAEALVAVEAATAAEAEVA